MCVTDVVMCGWVIICAYGGVRVWVSVRLSAMVSTCCNVVMCVCMCGNGDLHADEML